MVDAEGVGRQTCSVAREVDDWHSPEDVGAEEPLFVHCPLDNHAVGVPECQQVGDCRAVHFMLGDEDIPPPCVGMELNALQHFAP